MVAGLVLTVSIKVGELIDKLLAEGSSAIGPRIDLILLVAAAYATRKRSASVVDLLKGGLERSLY